MAFSTKHEDATCAESAVVQSQTRRVLLAQGTATNRLDAAGCVPGLQDLPNFIISQPTLAALSDGGAIQDSGLVELCELRYPVSSR